MCYIPLMRLPLPFLASLPLVLVRYIHRPRLDLSFVSLDAMPAKPKISGSIADSLTAPTPALTPASGDIEPSNDQPESINTQETENDEAPKAKGKEKAEGEDNPGEEDDQDDVEEDVEVVMGDVPLFALPEDYKFKPYITPEEGEKMSLLLDTFSDEQMRRYESYRRAAFPRAAMKRVMMGVTGATVPATSVIVMSGIAKVYCGEVVEAARKVQIQWNETGPLQPKHIREGVRRLRKKAPYTITGLPPPKTRMLPK